MKEISDIITAFDIAQRQGRQTALATVVHVDGSSYRRAGARMLITDEGKLTGAISGGCLEGDALRKALLVINEQKSLLVTYDTTDDDDAKLGVGLGCNGIIHILIEPIIPGDPANALALLKTMLSGRRQAVLVTLFCLHNRKEVQPGTCLLYLDGHAIHNKIPGDALREAVAADAGKVFANQVSADKHYTIRNHQFTAFIEFLQPAVSFVAIGAGNDVMPLAGMATLLGWEFTVADGRANYASRERFPSAHQVIVARPEEVLQHVHIDDRTVFALMTHNYNYDLAMLQQLLLLPVRYIGLLGPKKKLDRMLDELQEKDFAVTAAQLSRIYGPVGLDIGAETPEEIALSIVAEVKSVMAGRDAGLLRAKGEVIHPRSVKDENSLVLPTP